ncbi:hypothetical protein [Nostoc sp.]|uniref:hypothetical protein n=1 Tax=Nostoc sp. TaxID=1180 RepID=UPI002FF4C79A
MTIEKKSLNFWHKLLKTWQWSKRSPKVKQLNWLAVSPSFNFGKGLKMTIPHKPLK